METVFLNRGEREERYWPGLYCMLLPDIVHQKIATMLYHLSYIFQSTCLHKMGVGEKRNLLYSNPISVQTRNFNNTGH